MASKKKTFDRAKQAKSIASLGGKKTVEKYGKAHMSKLAKARHAKEKKK